MPFITIDPATIEVGKPNKKELWDRIKDNFDDHELRLQAFSGGSGIAPLINETVNVGSTASSLLTGIIYFEVIQECIATSLAIQFFDKSPATTGLLTVDVKKNTSTNPAGFASIMTSPASLNAATDANYTRKTGTINTGVQFLPVGTIVRIDVTSLPVGLQNFRVVLTGSF